MDGIQEGSPEWEAIFRFCEDRVAIEPESIQITARSRDLCFSNWKWPLRKNCIASKSISLCCDCEFSDVFIPKKSWYGNKLEICFMWSKTCPLEMENFVPISEQSDCFFKSPVSSSLVSWLTDMMWICTWPTRGIIHSCSSSYLQLTSLHPPYQRRAFQTKRKETKQRLQFIWTWTFVV